MQVFQTFSERLVPIDEVRRSPGSLRQGPGRCSPPAKPPSSASSHGCHTSQVWSGLMCEDLTKTHGASQSYMLYVNTHTHRRMHAHTPTSRVVICCIMGSVLALRNEVIEAARCARREARLTGSAAGFFRQRGGCQLLSGVLVPVGSENLW